MLTFKELVEQDVDEALTMAQRMKAKANFRRNRAKILIGRKRAMRRTATPERLKNRAKKAARKTIEKKMLQGKDKSTLSFGARQNLEKRVAKRAGAIERLSKKLLPTVRKKEMERRKNRGKTESYYNEALSPKADVSVWIDDFIASDAPQFQGKSKKERINMALAAHKAAQK